MSHFTVNSCNIAKLCLCHTLQALTSVISGHLNRKFCCQNNLTRLFTTCSRAFDHVTPSSSAVIITFSGQFKLHLFQKVFVQTTSAYVKQVISRLLWCRGGCLKLSQVMSLESASAEINVTGKIWGSVVRKMWPSHSCWDLYCAADRGSEQCPVLNGLLGFSKISGFFLFRKRATLWHM